MVTRRTDLAYRIPEQIAGTNQRWLARTDPAYRIPEQIVDTNQRRLAREQLFSYEMATKFDTSSRTYLYNQPCRLWNEECHHGCGYIHLLSWTSSTKKKCCANGALSSVSHHFDEELKMRFGMDEMPLFMDWLLWGANFVKIAQNIIIYLQLLLQRYATIVTILDLQIEVQAIIVWRWVDEFIISLQGYPVPTCKVVVYHFLFLTVWRHVHVCPNLEM